MTPHIEADIKDIAKTVLMPGDPLRAKYIADNYLEDVKLVSKVRNIYAYTGKYKSHEITVMASGMGMPSIGIYSYELYKFYNVENIIRIGSAGSYDKNIKLYDLILVSDSYSLSSFAKIQGYDSNIIKSSNYINKIIEDTCKLLNKKLTIGRVYSSDVFYMDDDINYLRNEKECLCVEMESFALFYNAQKLNKNAACILTISDNLVTHENASSMERQNSFNDMMLVALESVINL